MAPARLGRGQRAPQAACLLLACLAGAAGDAPRGFVTRAGAGFVLDGAPFHVVGANQYNLMTATAFGGAQAQLASGALENAQALGVNVMRTWAFCDGSRSGALQPRAGVFSEDTFIALDSVIAQARDRNIRLLLTLTNYWTDYGGISEYVSWAQSSGEYLSNKEDFFSSPACRQFYRNFATTLLTRVNTITGVAYRDDPTIFAWELINEPRVPQDWSGDVLQSWIADVSAHIKSIDPAHMVTTGVEGFFGPSTPDQQSNNPYGGSEGTDFHRNHDLDTIDFAVAHIWADQWKRNSGCDKRCLLAFIKQWHVSHLAASARLGKPFILEEFGAPRWWRDELFSSTYDITYGTAINGGAVGGDMLWILAGSSSVPDYDSYTVYPGDATTRALVANQARRMRELDAAGTPPPPPPPSIPTPAAPLYWPRLAAQYPGMPPMPPSPPVPAAAGESV